MDLEYGCSCLVFGNFIGNIGRHESCLTKFSKCLTMLTQVVSSDLTFLVSLKASLRLGLLLWLGCESAWLRVLRWLGRHSRSTARMEQQKVSGRPRAERPFGSAAHVILS